MEIREFAKEEYGAALNLAGEVYPRLGFCETGAEQTTDGIRYTPMLCVTRRADCPCKRTRCQRHGDCVSCREHHKADKKNTVYCQRPEREEKCLRRRLNSE